MGDWSEFFEDYPEENPGNYVNGRFDPQAAQAQRDGRRSGAETLQREQKQLDAEIAAIVNKHRKAR